MFTGSPQTYRGDRDFSPPVDRLISFLYVASGPYIVKIPTRCLSGLSYFDTPSFYYFGPLEKTCFSDDPAYRSPINFTVLPTVTRSWGTSGSYLHSWTVYN